MNVSYQEKLARLPEEQAKLKARMNKRAASKRTKKAHAAWEKYYRKNHPIVMRSQIIAKHEEFTMNAGRTPRRILAGNAEG
jgi:hypothetical protein